MTKNQIEYLKVLESQRSNRANEENQRAKIGNDLAVSLLGQQETQRHNLAQETNAGNQTAETVRHNINSELLQELGVHESERSNRAREAETKRANQAQEALSATSLQQSKQYQAASIALGHSQVGLGYSQLGEASRANQANEEIRRQQNLETTRSNVARENEQHRSNVVQESISRVKNAQEDKRLVETERHNKSQEVSMFIDSGAKVANSAANIAREAMKGAF